MEVLAERLKWLRDKRRLGQKEVAANIDITLSGYQKIEYNQANPKIDTLIKMAEFFGETTDFLLGLSDQVEEMSKLDSFLLKRKQMLTLYQARMDELRARIYELRNRMREREVQGESYAIEKREMNELMHRQSMQDSNYYETKMDYDTALFEYVGMFYSIPFSKPEKNRFIKDLLPFDVVLEEFADRNYKVKLISMNGNSLGTLFWKQSDDKEINYKEALESLERQRKFFRIETFSELIK